VPEKKAIEIQWLAGCSDGWASQEIQAVPDFLSASTGCLLLVFKHAFQST
jgi:hypothetical protein